MPVTICSQCCLGMEINIKNLLNNISGPSTQTDVVVSADGLNSLVVEFPAGGADKEFLPINIDIMDDTVGLEAVETYTASFDIISSVGNVVNGIPETTVINVLDNDSKFTLPLQIFYSTS